MNDAGIDIDWIVREVVRRLREQLASGSNGHAEANTNPSNTTWPGELSLEDKLVTLASLDGRLSHVQRVVVRLKAIVTPAARDFLKEKKIALVRGDRQSSKPTTDTKSTRNTADQVIVAAENVDFASLAKLLGNKIQVTASRSNTSDALAQAIECAASGRRAALLTDAPAATVMQANRNPAVRAALGYSYPAIRHAIEQTNANLLVLPPPRSSTEAAGMLGEFFRSKDK
jgi:hypothetical protein